MRRPLAAIQMQWASASPFATRCVSDPIESTESFAPRPAGWSTFEVVLPGYPLNDPLCVSSQGYQPLRECS